MGLAGLGGTAGRAIGACRSASSSAANSSSAPVPRLDKQLASVIATLGILVASTLPSSAMYDFSAPRHALRARVVDVIRHLLRRGKELLKLNPVIFG